MENYAVPLFYICHELIVVFFWKVLETVRHWRDSRCNCLRCIDIVRHDFLLDFETEQLAEFAKGLGDDFVAVLHINVQWVFEVSESTFAGYHLSIVLQLFGIDEILLKEAPIVTSIMNDHFDWACLLLFNRLRFIDCCVKPL